MSDDSAGFAAPHYQAFISYSHADGRFAGWLHRKLEGARLPDKPNPPSRQRLSPIFFDRAELAAGPDLSAQVREALAQSAALVVIASPAARVSRWVGQEIALFRALHPDRPILAALIEGEPSEAFPEALLRHDGAEIEPLAADFRKGKDGKRLGLLKIVAGLTAQPLDQLVQRDAQTRQRRVMAVTAGAVLLSLILAAALVLAIRARAEAERQRGEAEGLVEFMLTDLRDKLKGVGRLDVMDAVNQRVMERYADSSGSRDLSADELISRARLLQAMAEDDLSSKELQMRGIQEAEAAFGITTELLRREPDQPVAWLAHAKSHYWLGQARFLDQKIPANERRARAQPHWLEYRKLTAVLAARSDAKPEWLIEASYAEGNLCAIELSQPARPKVALAHCEAATRSLEIALSKDTGNLDIALNLSSAYAWQADALLANGRLNEALAYRRKQSDLCVKLDSSFAGDRRVSEAFLLADFGMAALLVEMRRLPEARSALANAESRARALKRHDPENRDWGNWLTQIINLKQKAA